MSRLAIFIDGGYLDVISQTEYSIPVDYARLTDRIVGMIASKTSDSLDYLRTFYYHCLPYQSNPPTDDEKRRYAAKRSFFSALKRIPRFTVREGRLQYKGIDKSGNPIFQQKRVDLQLGLDFALLSGKRQITHAAIVSGDSDLIPALHVAKDEGILVCLFHGPHASQKDGKSTFAYELWQEADERYEMDSTFMESVRRTW